MTKPIPPLDLSWLLIESPTSTTHVGAMLLFKKPAGRTPVVREIVEAYRAYRPAPPFNYVPELLGRGAPHFREVASWDPHYNIQHLALPAGARYDDLLRLIADVHEPMLDRDRPLFRCWIIEGVPGGMFAIYTKTHHSVIDGESGMKRLYAGLSTSDRHMVGKPGFALGVPAPTPHPPTPVAQRIATSIRAAVTQVGALNQVSIGALRKTLAGLVGSHLEGSLPFTAQHAPTNEPLKIGRRFATLSLPLEEMHEVARRFGATLNDVAVTVVDAGLHAYLRETGRAFAHPFISMCPVSLRADGDTTIGTRVSAMFVRLGEPRASASERIRQVADSIATAKKELGGMSNDAAMTYAGGDRRARGPGSIDAPGPGCAPCLQPRHLQCAGREGDPVPQRCTPRRDLPGLRACRLHRAERHTYLLPRPHGLRVRRKRRGDRRPTGTRGPHAAGLHGAEESGG